MSFSTNTALIGVIVCALCGCDEPPSAGPPRAPKEPPARPSPKAQGAISASGTQTAGEWELSWTQTVSAGVATDLAVCGKRAMTVTADGRVVTWDLGTLVPTGVLDGYAAATAIAADGERLLVGTADGRLLRANCNSTSPRASRNRGLPVRVLKLDARAKNRAFMVYDEEPSEDNKLKGPHINAALVDYKTGNSIHRPFRVSSTLDAEPRAFVDYRGEAWLSLAKQGESTRAWYLERFDKTQPAVEGLDGTAVQGFAQVSRHVWVYGGSSEGPVIARVDSGRAKPMLIGEEAWFGSRPGGDLPAGPIRAMTTIRKDLIIAAGTGAFRVDQELRRWHRIPAADDGVRITGPVTDPIVRGDEMLIGTPDGLVAISRTNWRRGTAESAPDAPVLSEPVDKVNWRGEVFSASKRGVMQQRSETAKARRVRRGPRGKVDALLKDGRGRLWAFGPDRIWVMEGLKRKQTHKFSARALGLSSELIEGIEPTDDGVSVRTSYGAHITLTAGPATND